MRKRPSIFFPERPSGRTVVERASSRPSQTLPQTPNIFLRTTVRAHRCRTSVKPPLSQPAPKPQYFSPERPSGRTVVERASSRPSHSPPHQTPDTFSPNDRCLAPLSNDRGLPALHPQLGLGDDGLSAGNFSICIIDNTASLTKADPRM